MLLRLQSAICVFPQCTTQIIPLSLRAFSLCSRRAELESPVLQNLASPSPSPTDGLPWISGIRLGQNSAGFHAINCGSQVTGNQRQSCSVLWSQRGPADCHRNVFPAALEQLCGALPVLSECWGRCPILCEFPSNSGICSLY